mgnify:CR=1 FL=1
MSKNILSLIFLLCIVGSADAAAVTPGASLAITHDFSTDASQPIHTTLTWGFDNNDIVTPKSMAFQLFIFVSSGQMD